MANILVITLPPAYGAAYYTHIYLFISREINPNLGAGEDITFVYVDPIDDGGPYDSLYNQLLIIIRMIWQSTPSSHERERILTIVETYIQDLLDFVMPPDQAPQYENFNSSGASYVF